MTPATDFVGDLVESMVARGFLLNKIGRGGNTLKIRPPMVFGQEHADLLADALDAALGEMSVPR
jgi:4-aminobutyrate aminotransferase-like enzyme